MSKKRRRRGRRRSSNGSYGMRRLRVAASGAVYGYLKGKTGILEKAPVVESIGRDGTNAVILHYLAKHFRNRWIDDMATAVAGHVGINLGKAGFDMAEFATLQGDDGISGVLGE